jgi:hypothetical protein
MSLNFSEGFGESVEENREKEEIFPLLSPLSP